MIYLRPNPTWATVTKSMYRVNVQSQCNFRWSRLMFQSIIGSYSHISLAHILRNPEVPAVQWSTRAKTLQGEISIYAPGTSLWIPKVLRVPWSTHKKPVPKVPWSTHTQTPHGEQSQFNICILTLSRVSVTYVIAGLFSQILMAHRSTYHWLILLSQ